LSAAPKPNQEPALESRNDKTIENICHYMRDNWLYNRIVTSYNDIVDHCCFGWNEQVDRPWLIMSIGMRDWAHRFAL
jgi:hypothetical protein